MDDHSLSLFIAGWSSFGDFSEVKIEGTSRLPDPTVIATRICNFEECTLSMNTDDCHSECILHRECFSADLDSPSLVTSECQTCNSYFEGDDDRFKAWLSSLTRMKFCRRQRQLKLNFEFLFKKCDFSSFSESKKKIIKEGPNLSVNDIRSASNTPYKQNHKGIIDHRKCSIKRCNKSGIPGDIHATCLGHRSCFNKSSRSLVRSRCRACHSYFIGEDDRFNEWLSSLMKTFGKLRHLRKNYEFLFRKCDYSFLSKSKQKIIKDGFFSSTSTSNGLVEESREGLLHASDPQKFQITKKTQCNFHGCNIPLNTMDLHHGCPNHRECFSQYFCSLLKSECQTCLSYFEGGDDRFREWLSILLKLNCCRKERERRSNFEFLFRKFDYSMLSDSKQKIIKDGVFNSSTPGWPHDPQYGGLGDGSTMDTTYTQDPTKIVTKICNFRRCRLALKTKDIHSLCPHHRGCFSSKFGSLLTSECPVCHSYFNGEDDRFIDWLTSLYCHRNLQDFQLNFEFLFRKCDSSVLSKSKQKIIRDDCFPLSSEPGRLDFREGGIGGTTPTVFVPRKCIFEGCTKSLNAVDSHSKCILHRYCFNVKLTAPALVMVGCPTCNSYIKGEDLKFKDWLWSLWTLGCCNVQRRKRAGWDFLFRNYDISSFSESKKEIIKEVPFFFPTGTQNSTAVSTRHCDFEGCEVLLNINDLHSACPNHRECFSTKFASHLQSECETCHSYFAGDDEKFRRYLVYLMGRRCCKMQNILKSNFEFLFSKCDSSKLSESKQQIIKKGYYTWNDTKIATRLGNSQWYDIPLKTKDIYLICQQHREFLTKNLTLVKLEFPIYHSYFEGDNARFKE